jgi:hypothetical protein
MACISNGILYKSIEDTCVSRKWGKENYQKKEKI